MLISGLISETLLCVVTIDSGPGHRVSHFSAANGRCAGRRQ
jgi:hypothetical protein